jgi:hypothetical protein
VPSRLASPPALPARVPETRAVVHRSGGAGCRQCRSPHSTATKSDAMGKPASEGRGAFVVVGVGTHVGPNLVEAAVAAFPLVVGHCR